MPAEPISDEERQNVRRELLLELADELEADAAHDRKVAHKPVVSMGQGKMHMAGAARQSQWARDLRQRAMKGIPKDAIGVGTTTLDMWRVRALAAEAAGDASWRRGFEAGREAAAVRFDGIFRGWIWPSEVARIVRAIPTPERPDAT